MPNSPQCTYVSDRSGIRCQVKGAHALHMAVDRNGRVVMKRVVIK